MVRWRKMPKIAVGEGKGAWGYDVEGAIGRVHKVKAIGLVVTDR